MVMYMVLALVFVAALAGAGYKGYQFGGNEVRVEWDIANTAAKAAQDLDRKDRESSARQSATRLQAKLATAEIVNRQIKGDLDRELAKKPFAADCVIPVGLQQLVNNALANGASETRERVPSTGKPAAAPAKPVDR